MKKKSIVLLIVVISLLTGCNSSNQNADNNADKITAEITEESSTEIVSESSTEAMEEGSAETIAENGIEVFNFTMGKDSFTVKGFKCDAEKAGNRPDAELLCIYECKNSDITLFTYNAEYIDGIDNNIILKFGGRYVVYKDKVLFQEIIKDIEGYELYGSSFVDPVHYIEGDFDNDGDIELACSFIMNRGSSYMNDKLCVFDYDKEEDTYNLYCLRFADFSDSITSVISEHYDSGYIWKEINDDVGGSIDVLAAMCTGMLYKEGQPSVRWGRWENVTLGNGRPMKIGMTVAEYPDGEQRDIAEISCNVLYLGDGEFSVEFSEYNEHYRWW